MHTLFPVGRDVSVKEVIVRILSKEWPLSVRQIYERARRMHAVKCSYQAVFKHVKELMDKGILECEGYYYAINREWLRQLFVFAQKCFELYEENPAGIIGPVKNLERDFSVRQRPEGRVAFEL